MHKQAALPSQFPEHLPDRFQERLAFNVADGAADLRDHHVRVRIASHSIYEFFDLFGNMRDHLYCFAKIFSPSFLIQDIPVYLSGRQVRHLI